MYSVNNDTTYLYLTAYGNIIILYYIILQWPINIPFRIYYQLKFLLYQ